MRIRRAVLVALAVSTTLLAGCGAQPAPIVTRLPTDAARPIPSESPSASPTAAPSATSGDPRGVQDCAGSPVVLTPGAATFTLGGDCPDVQVLGNDLVVDLTAADVDTLTVAGDRVSATIGDADAVTLQGNDSRITAAEIDVLVVRGDRNAVTAADSIDSVTVQGNDNTVLGVDDDAASSDEGTRNTID